MPQPQRNRRRIYLINRHYQLGRVMALLFVALGVMILSVLICTLIFLFLYGPAHAAASAFQMKLAVAACVGFTGVSLALVFFGIRLSHRTAGPMYHFLRVFRAIQDGDHGARVHLRAGDQWKEVAMAFNSAMDALDGRHAKVIHCSEELQILCRPVLEREGAKDDLKKMVELTRTLQDSL